MAIHSPEGGILQTHKPKVELVGTHRVKVRIICPNGVQDHGHPLWRRTELLGHILHVASYTTDKSLQIVNVEQIVIFCQCEDSFRSRSSAKAKRTTEI